MANSDPEPLPDTEYWRCYGQPFFGVLNWPDVDRLWRVLWDDPEGWYVYDPDPLLGTLAPEKPLQAAQFKDAVKAAERLVNSRRERSHSGAVYVNCRIGPEMKPDMIRVFDPINMGSACAGTGVRILPKWIISRLKPDPLPKVEFPAVKPGFFARLKGQQPV